MDDIIRLENIKLNVDAADLGTATATPCDVIFTSSELGDTLKSAVKVPVVEINNFINKKEIEEKGLLILKKLCEI